MNRNIIFAGSGEFACPILESLAQDFKISLVITQPDRPADKGNHLKETPIKKVAKELNLHIETPSRLEHLDEVIKDINPAVLVVTDYGAMIQPSTLAIPEKGVINIHPSLLPKYRGPSPIQSTLLNGDETTGTTFMLIDEKMDHGPILAQFKHQLEPNVSAVQLKQDLAKLSALHLPKILNEYLEGKIIPQPQQHELATFCKLIKKTDGLIVDSDTVSQVKNKIRAFQPWPGVWINQETHGKTLRVNILELGDKILLEQTSNKPTLYTQDKELYLRLSDGAIVIQSLKPEGKKAMTASEFLNGYNID